MTDKSFRSVARSIGSDIHSVKGFDGMIAILTGSYAYGTPREDSDVDIAILVSDSVKKILKSKADKVNGSMSYGHEIECGLSLHFGKLNMMVFTEQAFFDLWEEGTKRLKARGPVTREQAVEEFERLRKQYHYEQAGDWS